MDSLGYPVATGIESVSKVKAVFQSKLKILESSLEKFASRNAPIFEALELLNQEEPEFVQLLGSFENLKIPAGGKLGSGLYFRLGPLREDQTLSRILDSERQQASEQKTLHKTQIEKLKALKDTKSE